MYRVNSSSSLGAGATPGSSSQPNQPGSSTGHTVFYPNRGDIIPKQSPHPHFYPNGQPRHAQMGPSPDHMMGGMNEMPQGRFALPMQGQPQMHPAGMPVMMDRRYSNTPSIDDRPFMPMSAHATPLIGTSPLMEETPMPHMSTVVSPTDEMRQHHHQLLAHAGQRQRPMLQPRHSLPVAPVPPRPLLSRHSSLQVPAGARSASPHLMPVGDVFDADSTNSPVQRPSSSLGLAMSMGHVDAQAAHYQQQEDMVSCPPFTLQIREAVTD